MKRALQKWPIEKSFSSLSYRYDYLKPIQRRVVLVSCVDKLLIEKKGRLITYPLKSEEQSGRKAE